MQMKLGISKGGLQTVVWVDRRKPRRNEYRQTQYRDLGKRHFLLHHPLGLTCCANLHLRAYSVSISIFISLVCFDW